MASSFDPDASWEFIRWESVSGYKPSLFETDQDFMASSWPMTDCPHIKERNKTAEKTASMTADSFSHDMENSNINSESLKDSTSQSVSVKQAKDSSSTAEPSSSDIAEIVESNKSLDGQDVSDELILKQFMKDDEARFRSDLLQVFPQSLVSPGEKKDMQPLEESASSVFCGSDHENEDLGYEADLENKCAEFKEPKRVSGYLTLLELKFRRQQARQVKRCSAKKRNPRNTVMLFLFLAFMEICYQSIFLTEEPTQPDEVTDDDVPNGIPTVSGFPNCSQSCLTYFERFDMEMPDLKSEFLELIRLAVRLRAELNSKEAEISTLEDQLKVQQEVREPWISLYVARIKSWTVDIL